MTNTGTTGKKLTRFTVTLGKHNPPKKKGATEPTTETEIFSFITENAATVLGLTATGDNENAKGLIVRGTKGAKSIKVRMPLDAGVTTYKGKQASVPVPGWFTIKQMKAFIQAKIPTATHFISPDGRIYSAKGTTTPPANPE